jgi:hypothetical protein
MSVGQGTQIALNVARGLVLALGLVTVGCGSSAEPEESSDSNNPSIPVVGNYPAAGSAGQTSSGDGFKGWRGDAAGSSAGSAAAAGAVAAGSSAVAAGSGGSAGTASTAGAGGAAGNAAAAGSGGDSSSDDDPLGLFGPTADAPSCEGLICVEDQDCKELYPEESATCKFTKCVDFACK